jgi:hypothetical protein
VTDKVCNAIRAGNFYVTACRFAGISYEAFHEWMVKGEDRPGTVYASFAQAVKKAEADSEIALEAYWRRAAAETQHWTAAAALLERRFPERWARRPYEDKAKRDLELEKLRAEVEALKAKTKALQDATATGDSNSVWNILAKDLTK